VGKWRAHAPGDAGDICREKFGSANSFFAVDPNGALEEDMAEDLDRRIFEGLLGIYLCG
jgi:hypothetical protein